MLKKLCVLSADSLCDLCGKKLTTKNSKVFTKFTKKSKNQII